MSEKEIIARRGNMLIDAAYAPGSVRRMRLLLVAVSQIDEDITHETEISVSATGMADLLDGSYKGGSFYQELALAAQELRGMYVTSYLNADGSHRRRDRREVNVVSECHYLESEGRVALYFTPGIIPYLVDLKKGYHKFILSKVLRMKSAYGIRLYELIRRWSYPYGKKKVTVEEFRRLMGIKDGQYQRIGKLKEKVLNPAMQDVNERSDWGVRFGQIKSGRIVIVFQFWMWEKGKKGEKKARDRAADLPDGEMMKTSNGTRLYELIRSWECLEGTKEVRVEEFRQLMEIKDGQYQRMDKLKEKVLDPAISDVNEHSDWIVRFSQIKSGRKITHFQFKIWEKDKKKVAKAATGLSDGKIPIPEDFEAYHADVVTHSRQLGSLPNPYESKKALRAELSEGTVRDRNTGRVIQRQWEPVEGDGIPEAIRRQRELDDYVATIIPFFMQEREDLTLYQAREELKKEVSEGTMRDRKTGALIQIKGEPVKAE